MNTNNYSKQPLQIFEFKTFYNIYVYDKDKLTQLDYKNAYNYITSLTYFNKKTK